MLKHKLTPLLHVLPLLLVSPAWAMMPLDDHELGSVQGRDGLLVEVDFGKGGTPLAPVWEDSATASTIAIEVDCNKATVSGPCTGANMAHRSGIQVSDVRLTTPNPITMEIDVGSNASGVPFGRLFYSWDAMRLQTGGITIGQASTSGPAAVSWASPSAGQMVIESTGSLELINRRGLVDASHDGAYVNFTTQGDIMFRQAGSGAPQLSVDKFNMGFRFTDGNGGTGLGTFGITQEGFIAQAAHMDFDLNFDLHYALSPAADINNVISFDQTNRRPMVLLGWEGGIRNADLRLMTGGLGTGSVPVNYGSIWGSKASHNYDGSLNPANRTGGIRLLGQWDYDTNFAFILGETAGFRNQVRFYNWKRLGGNTPGANPYVTGGAAAYDFRMPLVVDTVNAGQGPGGICFGGNLPTSGSLDATGCGGLPGNALHGSQYLNSVAASNAMVVAIRDGRVHAYNNQVEAIDPAYPVGHPNYSQSFDWSLVYTYGKMDANIFLYPEGHGGSTGLKADILMAIQSPGYWKAAQANFNKFPGIVNDPNIDTNAGARWATNTHFLIADTNTTQSPTCMASGTCVPFGIGVVNADLLFRANGVYLRFMDETSSQPGVWLHATGGAQYQFRGVFGGGDMRDLSQDSLVRIALLDVNLNTSNFIFAALPPPVGETHLGFAGLLDFNGNAHVVMAEASNPTATFKLDGLQGRFMWDNGKVDIRSAVENGDGRPSLTIDNDLLVGTSAIWAESPYAGVGGHPAALANIKFGDGVPGNGNGILGRVAIPSGSWHSTISLKPQL